MVMFLASEAKYEVRVIFRSDSFSLRLGFDFLGSPRPRKPLFLTLAFFRMWETFWSHGSEPILSFNCSWINTFQLGETHRQIDLLSLSDSLLVLSPCLINLVLVH